jgi:hemerythrin
MPLIEWTPALSVGVDLIDVQHQKLLAIANDLHEATLEHRAKQVIGQTLADLIDYTHTHFATEERFFVEFDYADKEAHMAEHRALSSKVLELKAEFDAGNTAVTLEVMRFLKQWITEHLAGEDLKFAPFLREHGVH